MQAKHLIMGTAGHVDHGKTSLIRAMTGYDCDTHKQEKQRGITINLGFTNLGLESGNRVGVVDVPGHADFINTMVSGACGIDFVLLIIAADEGIMPQTREHIQIMELLGIKQGIIVLNKVDLVDEELLELAEEEVRDHMQNTFLSNAPICPVSSLDKSGIKELLAEIDLLVDKLPSREVEGFFRMYIDRIFTVEGFGLIVNGSALSGKVNSGDSLWLLPGERQVRVRRIERHGTEVDSVQAGDRAALNLAGFKQKEFKRGMLLATEKIQPTSMIDVRIKLFKIETVLGIWNQMIFLQGTVKQMVRIHLLDKDTLQGGEEALAQIYLPQPIVPLMGDRFILRQSSGDKTIGGGEIIDAYPLHHRRRRSKQIEIVKKLSSGDLGEIIAAEVRKCVLPVELAEIAKSMNAKLETLRDIVYEDLAGDISWFQGKDRIILLVKKQKTAFKNKVLNSIRSYHAQNPLAEDGRSFNELMGIFAENKGDIERETLQLLLEEMESEFLIKTVRKTWALYNHSVQVGEDFQNKVNAIIDYLVSCKFTVPLMSGITETAARNNISEKDTKLILQQLLKKEEIIHFQGSYVHKQIINEAKAKLIGYLKQHKDGISLAQYRDLINTNRKMASLLLDFFDKKNITVRQDNIRRFTTQFRKLLDG